jgi:predicted nucleic acid-binding protein
MMRGASSTFHRVGDGDVAIPVRSNVVYLLDTNVISELRKVRPHVGVMTWLRRVDDRNLHLSAVSLGEIQAGIEITREQDPAKASEIEAWANQIVGIWNVLPMDTAAFRVWAKLMRRSDILIGDAMIAATATVHGLCVVTRNVKDFRGFGVELFNPFKDG